MNKGLQMILTLAFENDIKITYPELEGLSKSNNILLKMMRKEDVKVDLVKLSHNWEKKYSRVKPRKEIWLF